jgi:hypothetical protein
MLVPRFRAEESWDLSGDVDIWFMDGASQELVNMVVKELKQSNNNIQKRR